MTELLRALVVSTGKNAAWIVIDGETSPRLAQLRRSSGKRSMPVPGDVVYVQILEDEKTLVERTEPRTFTLERRSAGGRSKTMAANVDALVTVTALASPEPRLVTLDQLLAFAELQGIEAIAVFTKPDLAPEALREELTRLYRGLGYTTLVLNPKTQERVDEFLAAIRGRRALMAGISGVGKSTIFRILGGEGAVGEVSRFGLGRQTTTTARLFRLQGGFLIDSPGVNEFGLGAIGAAELTQGFREMQGPATGCRFTDCSHTHEPDCGVIAAVTAGSIAQSRYHSYRKMLLEPA